ncbi:MAG: hypothetical protein ABFC63_01285 [Thermoguttaceae bacterium]
MIDPRMLVEHGQAVGLPAPVWFIQFFKALGFTLHAVPMNLWYAGLLVALLLRWGQSDHGRLFGSRLLRQMPVIVALGVNLGVVPLLFIQLAYAMFFYPATILMAWFWIAIIALLIPAYYGVYAYAWGIRNGADRLPTWRTAAGWIAALFFIVIGFTFANGLSLMDHVGRWPKLWLAHQHAGAALGTALNVGDPTLWPRWLLMFGLALGTTAAWVVFDAEWFARRATDPSYRRWAWGFARKLYALSLIWTAAAGVWYVFGTWSSELRDTMFHGPLLPLTLATALAPGLGCTLLIAVGWMPAKRLATAAVLLGQFGVLGINAVSRQVVQNVNLKPYLDVLAQPTDVQWGPLVMFLVTFVIGLLVVAWMIAQVRKCDA